MVNQPQEESKLHLEAMLYVLQDPALDRVAFEARLSEDVRLAEILADAVELFQSMRSVESGVITLATRDLPSVRTFAEGPRKSEVSVGVPSSWIGLVSLAASILLVGFLGWKSFQWLSPSDGGDKSLASTNRSVLPASGDNDSFKKVVWAWGEVGTGHHEEQLAQYVSVEDNEVALVTCESVCESDVPEWLVLATAAILEQGGGVDLPLENVDARTLIQ